MTLTSHIIGGTAASAAVYAATGSPAASGCCFVCSVAWDFDHFADFVLWGDRRFSVKYFFEWCYATKSPRFLLFLHSWELVLAFGAAVLLRLSPVLAGAFAGVLTHMALDELGNRRLLNGLEIAPMFYFFSWRLRHGFRREVLLRRRG